MKMKNYFIRQNIFLFLFILVLAVACTASTEEGSPAGEAQPTEEEMKPEEEMEHDEEMQHEDEHTEGAEHTDEQTHDEDHSHQRVPNNGAAIHIVSPADGASFDAGDEVTVEIELENFSLGEGNHWHVYVDGSSWGMVMGENTGDTLRGLEPGEHEIAVFLSIDTHEELEDGDAVMIVVEE